MSVYWKDVNRGQNLILSEQEGQEEKIGGYRDTKRGIDAYAQTFGYDPDRSRKGFATIEDAKSYVEAFKPWELYGVYDVTVDREVNPASDAVSTPAAVTSGPIAASEDSVSDSASTAGHHPSSRPFQPIFTEVSPRKSWWEFWKKG
ncbi:MAG: hypothetical protein CMJ45_14285 [Planctomyces sp.]|nr:hypothetical protein [Planctomyces sp.]